MDRASEFAVPDQVEISDELQLLLAEKRTALSLLRTGITVFALPLSVLSLLVATSGNYRFSEVAAMLLPLLVLVACLILLGCYLVVRAVMAVHRTDRHLAELKNRSQALAALIE
jgi:uncharacterized membrane protein YidH (DUF202 family)